ncbi:MAG: DUF1987 domain-containing protein [Bacteroidota bacterium]
MVEVLKIEGTPKTPEVVLDPTAGKLMLKGRSIPENSIEFYKPLIDWIDSYRETALDHTEIFIKLEYFNTSSSKCILDVFKKLENVKQDGKEVVVKWYYECDDEDMLEAGEDYEAILDLPFEMIEMEEMS